MLSSGKYKSILNLEAKYDIFHEILSTFNRKMDFYFTTSPSSFLCFQITWHLPSQFRTRVKRPSYVKKTKSNKIHNRIGLGQWVRSRGLGYYSH